MELSDFLVPLAAMLFGGLVASLFGTSGGDTTLMQGFTASREDRGVFSFFHGPAGSSLLIGGALLVGFLLLRK